jgi:hypothetical protein
MLAMKNHVSALVAVVAVAISAVSCSVAASKPRRPTVHGITSSAAVTNVVCTASHLRAAMEGSSEPGTGGMALAIVYVWNKSPTACALTGPVTITGLNKDGQQVTNSVRFTMPPRPAKLSPGGTRPGKHGQMPDHEVAATMLLIAAGTQPTAGIPCPGRLVDPAIWRITIASSGSITAPNASEVSGPALNSDGGLTTCRSKLAGQSSLLFERA